MPTLNLRVLKTDGLFGSVFGGQDIQRLQQAYEVQETGEVIWQDVPVIKVTHEEYYSKKNNINN